MPANGPRAAAANAPTPPKFSLNYAPHPGTFKHKGGEAYLDQVRFANSGTEATMDAIRVARAATGRELVVKIEGSYHGHHDTVMFSVLPNADAVGGRELPPTTPMSLGIPADVAKHTAVVPFNVERSVPPIKGLGSRTRYSRARASRCRRAS